MKEQVASIAPQLEELRQKREERGRQFAEVKGQIRKILGEIADSAVDAALFPNSEHDLSLRRLDEYHAQLQALQKEKVDPCRAAFVVTFWFAALCPFVMVSHSQRLILCCRVRGCTRFWSTPTLCTTCALFLDWTFFKQSKRYIPVWMNQLAVKPRVSATTLSTDWHEPFTNCTRRRNIASKRSLLFLNAGVLSPPRTISND